MDKAPRLIPIWLWVAAIIIITLLCSSCRGGRSLGKGSAGTVIIPQTPQQINERNRTPLEPLPPTPVAPLEAVRSTPTPPESKPAEANPVIINPKPAGELKPFQPTVGNTPKLITPPVKSPPTDNKATTPIVITPPAKNLPTDNKATTPEIDLENSVIITEISSEAALTEAESFNWVELLLNYLLFIIVAIFIWTIYDIIKGGKPKPKKKITSKRRPSKKSKPSKKKGSKKN